MNTNSNKLYIGLFIVFIVIAILAFSAENSLVNAQASVPYTAFTVPEYNLVCVQVVNADGISVSCVCPCIDKYCDTGDNVIVIPTEVATPVTTVTPKFTLHPTLTSIPPTATPTPKPDGIFIRHYDADGTIVWEKCMPPSAWNGHYSHAGHLIQDKILGFCWR